MQNLKLIHPIYLDVPMLVSFAAAVRGGIAFNSEVTEETSSQTDTKTLTKGRFALSSLFQSFFDASIEGSGEAAKNEGNTTKIQESRSHTEASLAILLYDQLERNKGYLLHPESAEDIANVEPGALVEVSGSVEKNAVDAIIDYMEALTIMTGLTPSSSQDKGKKLDRNTIDHMRQTLDKDRKRTPLSNIIVHCRNPKGVKAVVTLRRDNLRGLTLSELNKNTVRIVGKVTRIVDEKSSMSPFENYGMALMKPAKLKEIFDSMSTSGDIKIDLSDVEISGPAVQILPLMIYV